MSVLSESLLRRLRFSCQGWLQVLDWNMTRLNDTLLKVDGLLDTNIAGLSDGDVLQYDEGTAKFINVSSGFLTTTSTTSTTSSTTSTTSTTSSSTTTRDWRHAASYVITTGSLSSGTLQDTWIDDGSRLVINEVAMTPGFQVDFTWEGVPSGGFKRIRMNGYYAGNPAHNVKIQAWDYNFSSWTNLTADASDIADGAADADYSFLINDSDFYSGGQVQIRFEHTSAGNATHDILFDALHIVTTTTTSTSTTSTSTTTAP